MTLSPDFVSAVEQGYILAPRHRRPRARRTPLTLPAQKAPPAGVRVPKVRLPALPQVPIKLPSVPALSSTQPMHQLLDFLLK
jgi:hypothetical protein